jgi:hypothetical protein
MDAGKDRRHLRQMRQCLVLRRESVEALGRLISELESLRELLETTTDSWKRSFEEQWGTLEEVFAVTLDRGAPTMDEKSAVLVERAIAHLGALVDEALAGLPPELDE